MMQQEPSFEAITEDEMKNIDAALKATQMNKLIPLTKLNFYRKRLKKQ